MKTPIAILYSDRQFTTWNENIDSFTVKNVLDNIPDIYNVTIVHMIEPNPELVTLLKSFKFVVNLCYGYNSHSQADVALWLDQNEIPHLSTSGKVQTIVQDKLYTERLLINNDLPSVRSYFTVLDIMNSEFDYFIVKPRSGGCHRGIKTLDKKSIVSIFDEIDLEQQLIQPYLFGREFSVAIIPSKLGRDYIALDPVEIIPFPPREVFIAGQQYGSTMKEFKIDMDQVKLNEIKCIAESTHRFLNLSYFSRIDFRMHQNNFYILDVNSMPNLHPSHSMLPAILDSMEIPFSEFINRIIHVFENRFFSFEGHEIQLSKSEY